MNVATKDPNKNDVASLVSYGRSCIPGRVCARSYVTRYLFTYREWRDEDWCVCSMFSSTCAPISEWIYNHPSKRHLILQINNTSRKKRRTVLCGDQLLVCTNHLPRDGLFYKVP